MRLVPGNLTDDDSSPTCRSPQSRPSLLPSHILPQSFWSLARCSNRTSIKRVTNQTMNEIITRNPRTNTMIVEGQVTIKASKPAIWAAIANIEDAPKIISGIQKIEVLEKPATGLVGLKWRETRMLFGKSATAEKWITEAAENEFYKTKAEDGGFVFITTMRISEYSGGIMLTGSHETRPQGIGAKLMSIPMVLFFKGMIRKAALQDLNDIKAAVEEKVRI